MNNFGSLFRVQIFGESHGPAVGIVIDGCPAGLPLCKEDFMPALKRRQGGVQKGTTPRKETDEPIFISGIFNGHSNGAPICIQFENSNTRSEDYEKQQEIYRPGHADFTAEKKFSGFQDYRGGGHFSGRLTVCLVAAGVIAEKILQQKFAGYKCNATIDEVGGCSNVEEGLHKAIDAKDSVGGIVSCRVVGLPVGIGEPFFVSVESHISAAVFAIPAIKGIEWGAGFAAAKMFGTEHNDALLNEDGLTETNHAGGIVGGISNGNDINFRIAVKPTSSTAKQQESYNKISGEVEAFSLKGRHDLCIALRVPPVLEAVTNIALADLLLMANNF